MPRLFSTLVSLMAILTAVNGHAQTAENDSIPRLPSITQSSQIALTENPAPLAGETLATDAPNSVGQSNGITPAASPNDFLGNRFADGLVNPSHQTPLSENSGAAADETLVAGEPISLDGSATVIPVASLQDFVGYRYATSSLDWMPGAGDQFGMFSILGNHYQKSGYNSGVGIGTDFNFVGGPSQTDMPAHLFDFSIAYQIRQQMGPLAFDLATSVMVSSDFEGCVRKGFRYPAHAVGYLTIIPTLDLVFGVDYLARADIKLLPVAGLIWAPSTDMRFELVFPRPKAIFQLNDSYRLYVYGELGGGTWAIERESMAIDLATYRDLRVCVGLEHIWKSGQRSAFEAGYLFDRHLEYTSGIGDMPLNDSVIFRLVTTY